MPALLPNKQSFSYLFFLEKERSSTLLAGCPAAARKIIAAAIWFAKLTTIFLFIFPGKKEQHISSRVSFSF
jgi:hypothetical protein